MSVAAVKAVLADGPATSWEVAAELEAPLGRICALMRWMAEAGHIHRSDKKVRLRKQSPGAYLYSNDPFTPA